MADITNIIPTIPNQIDAYYVQKNVPRSRLGLSQIGEDCKRVLWYRHRGLEPTQPDGRILRLFELGNILEDHIVHNLLMIGISVYDWQEVVTFEDGDTILTGHTDGRCINVPGAEKTEHLLEIKTAGDKSFKALLKAGSYEKWSPKYSMQIQAYLLGLNLTRCLVVVYNKNTSDLYTERININKPMIAEKLVDVFNIIKSEEPPDRISNSPSWYQCRWCNFKEVCHGL